MARILLLSLAMAVVAAPQTVDAKAKPSTRSKGKPVAAKTIPVAPVAAVVGPPVVPGVPRA